MKTCSRGDVSNEYLICKINHYEFDQNHYGSRDNHYGKEDNHYGIPHNHYENNYNHFFYNFCKKRDESHYN